MRENTQIRVAELFAGVGGFRLGLERLDKRNKNYGYKVVWSNQWEPATRTQHASEIYKRQFGANHHSNVDIADVDIAEIPNHDLLVGGFPCQDYSVAKPLSEATGIIGIKGVLWWQIHRIIKKKKRKPSYLLLENVDRLVKSPANQRGRDFAIMLASLSDLGYAVEWRIINAADYGFPQRRRRVFFIGYHRSTDIYKRIKRTDNKIDWLTKKGVFAKAFPIFDADKPEIHRGVPLEGTLHELTNSYNVMNAKTMFHNAGVMINRSVWTIKTNPNWQGTRKRLGDIVAKTKHVPPEYYLKDEEIPKWLYLKGPKKAKRKSRKTGHEYHYEEGGMVFPDNLESPSRTIVTGEGGSTPSRFKHVVRDKKGLRRLIPEELEALNGFRRGFTDIEGITSNRRAFLMGNALVVGVIRRIGRQLIKTINNSQKDSHV